MSILSVSLLTLGGIAALYLVIGSVNDLVWAIRRRRYRQAAALLSVVMFGSETDAEDAAEELCRMPRGLLIRSLQSLAADVTGDSQVRLQRLVAAVGLRTMVDRASRRYRFWRRRVQAAQLSQLLPPGDPIRRRLLRDPNPVVRARALDGTQADEIAADIDTILEMLHDPTPMVRAAAQRALLAADGRVVPPLIRALETGQGDAVNALLEVVAGMPDARLLPAISEHAASADPRRRARVAQALAASHSRRAGTVLSGLVGDEDPSVRTAAVTAVGQIGASALAGAVGKRLADESWDVRRAAAEALGALGPAGWMVLRNALRGTSPDAAEMARQMLDHIATARIAAETLSPEQLAAFGEHLPLVAAP